MQNENANANANEIAKGSEFVKGKERERERENKSESESERDNGGWVIYRGRRPRRKSEHVLKKKRERTMIWKMTNCAKTRLEENERNHDDL